MVIIETVKTKPLNILLVEDDDGDAKAVERAFKQSKIANTWRRAIDGIDALEILKGVNGKQKMISPFLLLVDINMPRMNGIEFIRVLRSGPELRRSIVFVLTTSKRDADITESYDLNVSGYILKSTAGQDFLNVVTLVNCYWRIVEVP